MKLNVGCGDNILDGYDNIDKFDFRDERVINEDIIELPSYEENTVDEILAEALIEHLNAKEFYYAIRRWYKLLKPNGFIQTECPDIMYVAKMILQDGLTDLITYEIWGQYWRPWDKQWNGDDILNGQFHKNGFTYERIQSIANEVGFKRVERMDNTYKKYKNPYSLCVRWYK